MSTKLVLTLSEWLWVGGYQYGSHFHWKNNDNYWTKLFNWIIEIDIELYAIWVQHVWHYYSQR